MAFIPVPNIVQARLQWQNTFGALAQNVFYHACTGPVTLAQMDEIGAAWTDWLVESWQGFASSTWSVIGIGLRDMTEEEGIGEEYTTGLPIPGTIGEQAAPNQVTYTVTWSTGLIGRSARGRTYALGLYGSQYENENRLKTTTQSSLQTRWTNLLTIMDAAAHALQVVSFAEGGVPRVTGRALPVLSCNVRFPLATQRRRVS